MQRNKDSIQVNRKKLFFFLNKLNFVRRLVSSELTYKPIREPGGKEGGEFEFFFFFGGVCFVFVRGTVSFAST